MNIIKIEIGKNYKIGKFILSNFKLVVATSSTILY